MFRITVNANRVALVWRRGVLLDILTEGKHWVGFWTVVEYYDTLVPIMDQALMPYLEDFPGIEHYIDIKTVGDNEIGIENRDGLYSRTLTTGKVGYWNDLVQYTLDIINKEEVEVPASVKGSLLVRPEIARLISTFPVEATQIGLLYVDGVLIGRKPPGIYRYWRTDKLVTMKIVETRIQGMEVAGQEILTKDKAGIRVNFHAQYKVMDVEKAITGAVDYYKQLYAHLQMLLRSYIGTMTLDQLLANKEKVGPFVMSQIGDAAADLGVKVLSGGIKDVILPGEVKTIMNQVLIAQKQAQANTIARQEETASTRSLLNTAKLMESNAMLLKLKEMEYMEKIADKIGEITVNGGSRVMDQLETLLVSKK